MAQPQNDAYYTLNGAAQAEQNIKRSRFIGYAYPVSGAEQAMALLAEVRSKHHSATHVCWAYRLAPTGGEEQFRYSDDGEPSGTAGKPIYGRLAAADVWGVLIAVVRYFGGVKLGPSGLIEAYRSTAALALEEAPRRQVIQYRTFQIAFAPDLTGLVMRTVKEYGAQITQEAYTNGYQLTLCVRASHAAALQNALQQIYGVTLPKPEP